MQTITEKPAEDKKTCLFANAKDEDLLMLGVPEMQLPFIRSLPNKEAFHQAETSISHDVFENLSWLAEGFPMDEVLQLAASNYSDGEKSEDLSVALDEPSTLKSFVVVEGEDELC